MTRARRSEGPRAPLFYSAAALLVISGKMTAAQTVDLSSLEICANLETPELKLACFEAIIAAGRSPAAQASEAGAPIGHENAPVAGEPENAPAATEPEIAVAAVPENDPVAVGPAVAIADAPENPRVEIEPEPDEVNSQVAPEATPLASVTPSDEDFGREQLAAPDQEEGKEGIKAVVVEVAQGYNKTLYFHLANGHVWRQIEPRRLQYPKSGNFEVNITQGVMGEYRMRIGDNGRLVRIRRVK